jgi:16S rRNA (uracil1498-N3)-methyltransferase
MGSDLSSQPEPIVSQRFYCPDPPRDGRYQLPADEARHLTRVCRHVPGDRVEIFDGKGFATSALIVETGKDSAVLVAKGPPLEEFTSHCALTLATAIPKGDRFDWLVEKATELGIVRLIPLVTEHSVVDPRDSKLDRLRRTIIEASKQSRRNRLMVLDSPMSWVDLVQSARQELRLLARPGGLPPGCWPRLDGKLDAILAVGPEGGFSPAEEELALAAGWHPIRLSSHILRVETAGLAGAAAILALCEERAVEGLDRLSAGPLTA